MALMQQCEMADRLMISREGASESDLPILDQVALVLYLSPVGAVKQANGAFLRAAGYTGDELAGFASHDLLPDLSVDMLADGGSGAAMPAELRVRTKCGEELWLALRVIPRRTSCGNIKEVVLAGHDVTELVKLRRAMEQSSKLMQLGHVTATVAHEIRNPLGAIRTAVFMLEKKLGANVAGVSAQLDRINNNIRRCDKIITELLDFSRRKAPTLQTIALDRWIAEIVADECQVLPKGTILEFAPGAGSVCVDCDPDQMRQVMINLIANAGEAMAEKLAACSDGDGYVPKLKISTEATESSIRICIEDNGPGIEEANLPRILEPLFTTKSFGVGLGLPAIEKILKNHGGGLHIASVFGRGATMTASIQLKAG